MFDRIKARLRQFGSGIPASAIATAARAVEAQYLADSTSRTGRTPDGVRAVAGPSSVTVVAPAWSMAIARKKGQPAKWLAIVAAEARRALTGSG